MASGVADLPSDLAAGLAADLAADLPAGLAVLPLAFLAFDPV